MLDTFTSALKNYYGGNAQNVDFIGHTEDARLTINKWVEDMTNNRIKDLIPAGALNSMTRLVLTNAVYFKGTWKVQFDPKKTLEANFHTGEGTTVQTPMMMRGDENAVFPYADTSEAQILELPYDGNDLSMLVILPKENQSAALEQAPL